MKVFKFGLLFIVMIFFTACGSGGGSSNANIPIVQYLDLEKPTSDDGFIISITYTDNGNRLTEKREDTESIYPNIYQSTYAYDFNSKEATENWTRQSTSIFTDSNGNQIIENNNESGVSIYDFDETGLIHTKYEEDEKGNIREYAYTYDNQGNLYTVSYESVNENGYTNTEFTIYSPNRNKVSSEAKYTSADGSWGISTTLFDDNGNPTKNILENSYGQYTTTTYSYDVKGNLLVSHSIDLDGSWQRNIYTYTSSGKVLTYIWTTSYDIKGSIYYTYDENGYINITESTTEMNPTVFYSKTTFVDRVIREIISTTTNTNDGTWKKTISTYDENGKLIYETTETGQN